MGRCRDGRETPGYDPSDDTCRRCGSLNPDTFMARLEKGDVEVVPTDKNYKAYVRNAGGENFKQTYGEPDKNEKGEYVYDEKGQWMTTTVTRTVEEAKFYYEHLSDEQRKRFVEIYNEQKMKL